MPSDDPMQRRGFLKAAGGAAAAATLAGCVNTDQGSPSPSPGEGDGDGGGATPTDTGGDGDGGQPTGTLVYSRGSHSPTLDPQQTTSGEVVKVTNQIFDTLIDFVPGGGGKLTAGLATDYSLEGTTASLTLREGVTFHNGDEFTAEDFIATYRRFTQKDYQYFIGSKNQSGYASFTLGSWVEGMTANGDHQLEITLKEKYAPFLRNLAMFATSVMSKTHIQSLGDNQGKMGEQPVGTGPFALAQLDDANERILLEANTEFWGDGPNVQQVIFNTIGQNSTRAQSLIQGESHIIDGIGAQASQTLQDADAASLLRKDGINIGYMAMNMARFEPFREKAVRQAISYAINTEAIVNEIYQGFAKQADQPIPPTVFAYNDDIDPYPMDKDRARQMLNDAGYGDGFTFELATFKNPRGYNPSPIQTAQQVKSDLGDIGITVNIKQMSFDPFLNYTLQGKHDACFLGWYTDNADPDNFYYALLHPQIPSSDVPDGQDWVSWENTGNGLNVAAWANTEYMDLVTQAQSTYERSQRTSLYRQAGSLAHDEAPWVFIDYAETLRGAHQSVENYTISSIGGPYLEYVSLSN